MLGRVADPAKIDTSVPHPARVYDYRLGGKDTSKPTARRLGPRSRSFRTRSSRRLPAARSWPGWCSIWPTRPGYGSFSTSGPACRRGDNVHEVAQSVAPDSRVVYVDNDPIVLLHAEALLTSSAQGTTAYLDADLRDTGRILGDAGPGPGRAVGWRRPQTRSVTGRW